VGSESESVKRGERMKIDLVTRNSSVTRDETGDARND